jgi:hypothetical protein
MRFRPPAASRHACNCREVAATAARGHPNANMHTRVTHRHVHACRIHTDLEIVCGAEEQRQRPGPAGDDPARRGGKRRVRVGTLDGTARVTVHYTMGGGACVGRAVTPKRPCVRCAWRRRLWQAYARVPQ